jgi:hypothetical protein
VPKQGREARELLRWETGVSAAGYSYSISGALSPSAMKRSIRAVTTGSGTEPSSSTASWNARMLNLKLAHCPTCSSLPSRLYLDHSHCPVLAPATLAALPSTRAIETRSLPTSLAATHRGLAFYVALPKSSIPSIAACSMSLIPSDPFAHVLFRFPRFNGRQSLRYEYSYRLI